jgi:large subunit ribosomal protein L25
VVGASSLFFFCRRSVAPPLTTIHLPPLSSSSIPLLPSVDTINARLRPAGTKAGKLRSAGRTPGTVTGLPGNAYAHLTLAAPDVAALVRRHGRRGLAARQVDLRVRLDGEGGGSPATAALAAVAEGGTAASSRSTSSSSTASTTPTASTLTLRALPHQVHINAVTGAVENVNFLALPAGKAVTASVPVSVLGADLAPGVKRGGFLNLIRRAVRVSAPHRGALPSAVEVDASGLELGQRVALGDLALPAGAVLAEPHPELPVLKVAGRQART